MKIGAVQAAVMLLAGIFIGLKVHPSLWFCMALFAASLAGGVFFYQRGKDYVLDQLPKRISRGFFCIVLFTVGMGRTAFLNDSHPSGSIDNYSGQKVSHLTGHIISPPLVSNSRTTLRVQIEKEQESEDLPNEGRILLVFYHDPKIDFHYGDRLSFSGTVTLPPDSGSGFSYRDYLERDGISSMINNPYVDVLPGFSGHASLAWIYQLRSVLLNRIYQLFPKPENALMAGILLGDESKITSEIERNFQKTGTAHIIAISGANFTVLTWLLLSILRRTIPHWWAPILMLPFIFFYTILVGGNSAVVRAAIMCSLSIIGSIRGRTGNGINNLSLSAVIMCLWKPVMIYDLGFQLSATATLGILLFSEPLSNLVRSAVIKIFPKISEESLTSVVNVLNDLCILSISAQIFTTWISAQAFGQISLISLPANFLIAPFQSLIMLGGFTALLLSFLFYPFGAAAAWLVWAAPALTIRIVQFCADLKWGAVYFDLPPWQAWTVVGLIAAVWAGRQYIIGSVRRRNFQSYYLLLLLFSAVMIWVNAADRLNKRTSIEFHQSASSILLKVRSPENRIFLIGDNLTNYGAQDLLEKQVLPIPLTIDAAWLDIREPWMQREFTASGTADNLSVLYLNGISQRRNIDIAEKLEDGYKLTADGIGLQFITAYMERRSWIIEQGEIRLLFPNGIPPERIFYRGGPEPDEITLVILGKRDEISLWEDYRESARLKLQLQDFSDEGDVMLIIKKGQLAYQDL